MFFPYIIIFVMKDMDNELEKIKNQFKLIEHRLSKLEALLGTDTLTSGNNIQAATKISLKETENEVTQTEEQGIETQIGRFGLAWLGNIVLLMGIIFLVQYLTGKDLKYLPFVIGYSISVLIFLLAGYIKSSNEHLSFIFRIHSHILIFYLTLRLYFFNASPLLPGKGVALAVLLLLVGFQVYISLRDKSQMMAFLTVVFMLITALSTGSTRLCLPIITATAAGSVYYYYRFRWTPLSLISILLVYAAFTLWMAGNPVAGNKLMMITSHESGLFYMLGLGTIFSIIPLFRSEDGNSDDFIISTIFVNGFLFTALLALFVLRFYLDNYILIFGLIALFCLGYSTYLHAQSDWNFASAFYALYGFMAMSISIYGYFGLPKGYFLLSVQSLVVVSMALWFGNRLIIVMNNLLFFAILVIYLLSSKPIDSVNFSFALVALLSARIINWQKSRLKIRTEFIRNFYLLEAFFMVLYSLFYAVPRNFVTFSWTVAALMYFIISLLLKNIKYRYMALGTLVSAAVFLFIVDLAKIELIYRVFALLFLATLSIGISIFYTKKLKKTESE